MASHHEAVSWVNQMLLMTDGLCREHTMVPISSSLLIARAMTTRWQRPTQLKATLPLSPPLRLIPKRLSGPVSKAVNHLAMNMIYWHTVVGSLSIKIVGSIARLTRLLCLSLLVTKVLPSADIKPSKMNVTSSDVVFGKRSYYERKGTELESMTQSNTCFSGGGCESSSSYYYYAPPTETATCNPGTYVYQITGYSGVNKASASEYATRFDIVCSDGYTATIGETASYHVSSTTIINPQGYTAVLAGGGCITDHIQIGGTDFGNAGYGPLSSCSCAPGLSFVGFGTLEYLSDWPSFPYMSIECDVACPRGTYYSNGNCGPCIQGIEYINYIFVVHLSSNRDLLLPWLHRLQPQNFYQYCQRRALCTSTTEPFDLRQCFLQKPGSHGYREHTRYQPAVQVFSLHPADLPSGIRSLS